MKRTGSGFFRTPNAPNQRIQDGFKLPMLCPACEVLFSKVETRFAMDVFKPLVQHPTMHVEYREYMLPFLISVMWRNMAVDLDRRTAPVALQAELNEIEPVWRNYLLGRGEVGRYGQVHLLITDFAVNESPQINEYLTRSSDATSIWADSKGLIGYYAKFAKFIAVADFGMETAGWRNTLVDPSRGHYEPFQVEDRGFFEFLHDRADRFRKARRDVHARMTPAQRDLIKTRIDNLGHQYRASELHSALVRDAAWDRSVPRVGRNQVCPCGSGKKYKRCHGA